MTSSTARRAAADRRFRRAASVWLLAIVAVIVIAGVAIAVVNSRGYGPEHAVRAYLDALRDGDGARALGLLGATVPDGDATLLTGEPLERSVEGLSDLQLSDDGRSGDDATVTAHYTLGGSEHSTEFSVHRTGSTWLFFDQWALAGGSLPRTSVGFPGQDRAAVDGVAVGLPQGRTEMVSFYPARVEASFSSTLVQAPLRTTVVTTAGTQPPLALEAKATPAMTATVNEQLRRGLDRCTAQRVLAPAGCPFYHFTDNQISGPITWRITTYPAPVIDYHGGAWTVRPLTGQARLTTRETDLYTGAEKDVDTIDDFTFGADLTVDGDTVTVQPRIAGPDTDG